jgi:hypothetical protein
VASGYIPEAVAAVPVVCRSVCPVAGRNVNSVASTVQLFLAGRDVDMYCT